jgi:hypothetical protein
MKKFGNFTWHLNIVLVSAPEAFSSGYLLSERKRFIYISHSKKNIKNIGYILATTFPPKATMEIDRQAKVYHPRDPKDSHLRQLLRQHIEEFKYGTTNSSLVSKAFTVL